MRPYKIYGNRTFVDKSVNLPSKIVFHKEES